MKNPAERKGANDDGANGGPQEEKQSQRLLAVILVACVAAFFFGFFHILNTIRTSTGADKLAQANTNALGAVGQEIQTLKSKDTDGDGLSDYDELYVDKTSPYLKDSDGDGTSDSAEITQGTDPNCPQGAVCSALGQPENANTSAGANSVLGANQSGTGAGQFTASELRKMLRDAGAPATQLDAMSDEQIIAAYQQAYEQQTNSNTGAASGNSVTNGVGAANGSTVLNTTDLSALQNFTPAQIREFLKAGGADDATLNQMDDATLQAIFQGALNNMNTNP